MSNHTASSEQFCQQSINTTVQHSMGMVVYSSQEERLISLVVMLLILAVTLIGHSSVILTVMLTEKLREMPHFILITCYCVGDIVTVLTSVPVYALQFVAGCIPHLPCRLISAIGISVGFGLPSHIGYMAWERWMYFCYPMRYESFISNRKIAAVMSAIYGMSLLYTIGTEVLIGRSYHPTVLLCNLPSSGIQSAAQMLLFILPAAVITIISVLKIWKLSKRCAVAPIVLPSASAAGTLNPVAAGAPNPVAAGAANPSGADPTSPALPVRQAKRAFRMMVLVSGAFWGTMLPTYTYRTFLFNSGFTWAELDSRADLPQAITLRLANYVFSSISSLINPLTYYYSRKDLRAAFCKLVGLRKNTAPSPDDTN